MPCVTRQCAVWCARVAAVSVGGALGACLCAAGAQPVPAVAAPIVGYPVLVVRALTPDVALSKGQHAGVVVQVLRETCASPAHGLLPVTVQFVATHDTQTVTSSMAGLTPRVVRDASTATVVVRALGYVTRQAELPLRVGYVDTLQVSLPATGRCVVGITLE
jgi:hypothetical protein